MVKLHKAFNWKGRQVVETVIDESEQKKIQLDFKEGGKYDSSNALVLPSKKRRVKKLQPKNAAPIRLLSKKKRKKLEKIIDQKLKKENRAELLKALEEVRVPNDKLKNIGLISLQHNQTRGRKKYKSDGSFLNLEKNPDDLDEEITVNVTRGKKQKKSEQILHKNTDPNIIHLGEVSSSDEDYESDDKIEEMEDDSKPEDNDDNEDAKNIENDDDIKKDVIIEDSEEKSANLNNEAKQIINVNLKNAEEINKSISENVVAIKKYIPSTFKVVKRLPAMQKGRLKLPILSEEQAVMEAINENSITIVVGPTGSGKTTQVPQFLYEAGYTENGKLIGVTEPRRVAAIAMSNRVGDELNLKSKVSYQIRFEGNTTDETEIKFMTDGVLLKESQMDPFLKKYSVIIIDEAHERSVYSDILIGILSRIIPKREAKGNPLKLVIMSATLRIEDFVDNKNLFKDKIPPVVKIESRMFDVSIHFNKKTPEDYVVESFKKACKIHCQLPEGGILIFVTGKQEIKLLCRKLREKYPLKGGLLAKNTEKPKRKRKRSENMDDKKDIENGTKSILPEVNLSDFANVLPDSSEVEMDQRHDLDDPNYIEDDDDYDFDIEGDLNIPDDEKLNSSQPLYVLPLYSMMMPEKQQRVFLPPPEGTRLCIIATNVAETSLTIPNIKYIVDSGKVKEKFYDPVTGVSMFNVSWISQASANQRAGRAGRTSDGHCYRLYSSAVFNDELPKYSTPDIQKKPIDDLVLVMKAMGLPVVNFPFPTPPNRVQIKEGLKRLQILGALEERKELRKKYHTQNMKTFLDLTVVTPLGNAMSRFSLSPRYAKMLVLSHQYRDILPFTTLLVCALTVKEVLVEIPLRGDVEPMQRSLQSIRHSWLGGGNSKLLGDLMILLKAVGSVEYHGLDRKICETYGLRYKAMEEIRKLRRQLTNEINLIAPSSKLFIDPQMKPPTDNQALMLCQIVLSGSVDHIAKKIDPQEIKDPKDRPKWKKAYRVPEMEEPVFIPKSSALYSACPEYVVYQDIYDSSKKFIRVVSAIDIRWLPILSPQQCTFSPPSSDPRPFYDKKKDCVKCYRRATFSSSCWPIPETCVEFPIMKELFPWFGKFFLDGEICPKLIAFKDSLFETETLVSSFAIRYRDKRESLVFALVEKNISNLVKLKAVWEQNPKYLLSEYLMWVKDEELKLKIEKMWPPIPKSKLEKKKTNKKIKRDSKKS